MPIEGISVVTEESPDYLPMSKLAVARSTEMDKLHGTLVSEIRFKDLYFSRLIELLDGAGRPAGEFLLVVATKTSMDLFYCANRRAAKAAWRGEIKKLSQQFN